MPRFALINQDGDPIVVVEAASREQAQTYGQRSVTGFAGDLYEVASPDETEQALRESLADAFRTIGLSESEAAHAARGRNAAGGTLGEQLAESFAAMGLSESVARQASIGRESPLAVKQRDERKIPVVKIATNASGAQSIKESPAVPSGDLVMLQESASPIVSLRETRPLSDGERASLRAVAGRR